MASMARWPSWSRPHRSGSPTSTPCITATPSSAGGYVLLAAGGLALIWRRRFIVAVLAATYLTTLWYATTANQGGPIWDAVVVAFGTAIYFRKRGAALVSLIAGYAGFLWLPALAGTHEAPSATFALALAVGLLVMLAGAEGIRFRHERTEAQRRIKAEEARRLASEERVRIARDLHDVVAHNISVINVQAATALHLADRQPERAIEAPVHHPRREPSGAHRAAFDPRRPAGSGRGCPPRSRAKPLPSQRPGCHREISGPPGARRRRRTQLEPSQAR